MEIPISNIYQGDSWFEVLQTTDQSQTAVMTLKPGRSTGEKPESHENSQQIMLLVEGELLAQVNEEQEVLKAGDVIVILPGVEHRFTNQGKIPAVTFNVYFPPEYSPEENG